MTIMPCLSSVSLVFYTSCNTIPQYDVVTHPNFSLTRSLDPISNRTLQFLRDFAFKLQFLLPAFFIYSIALLQLKQQLSYTNIYTIIEKRNKGRRRRKKQWGKADNLRKTGACLWNCHPTTDEIPRICGIWRFITASTKACHLTLSWGR